MFKSLFFLLQIKFKTVLFKMKFCIEQDDIQYKFNLENVIIFLLFALISVISNINLVFVLCH